MAASLLPILLFAACSLALALGMLGIASIVGPKRQTAVKQMAYESGMDPIHDAHRKFDVRFHLVAIAHAGFFGSRPFSAINSALADFESTPIDWDLP